MPNHTLEEVILGADSARSPFYFNGRLLTAEDLGSEHSAARAREQGLGRLQRAGVALGLHVTLASSPTASPIVATITRGLALNTCGQIIELCDDITLALEKPATARPVSTSDRAFARCAPASPTALPTREGAYVLTLSPATRKEGRASVSGLGNGIAPCNAGRLAQGVQFRLVELSGHGFPSSPRLRNQLAWLCLGLHAERPTEFARLPAGNATPPADPLRSPTGPLRLADCEVPLALLYWSSPTRLDFIDLWAVRRNPNPPDPESGLGFLLGATRNGEISASILQFEAHLRTILAEPGSHAGLSASQRFVRLPPAGFLPIGANRPTASAFFGPHTNGEVIPVADASVRAILRASLAREPWRVLSTTEAAAATPDTVTRLHLYRAPSLPDHLIFARSARGESVAADIHFDNRECQLPDVSTVQQAIEALCHDQDNCCTLVVSPEPGWEQIFNRINPNQDAEICFQAGTFTLPRRVAVTNKGHLRLVGAGPGTRLVATASETILLFQNCRSISLENLHAEANPAAAVLQETDGLNGVITCVDCPDVNASHLSLRSAPGTSRASTCLTVRNTSATGDNASRSSARIEHCQLEVGHEQTGILVTNCQRVQIEDNTLRVTGSLTPGVAVGDAELRGRLRRHLIDSGVAGELPPSMRRETNATVTVNRHPIHFLTATELITGSTRNDNAWQTALNSLNPQGMTSPTILLRHVLRLADAFLQTASFGGSTAPAAVFTNLRTTLLGQILPSMSQAIVIGGQFAGDIRILNNSIRGAQQGIHIGVSHREGNRGSPDAAGFVSIQGNTLQLTLPTTATRERHGIFVGNCRSVLIENNHLDLQRATRMAAYRVEGIRLFGHLDRRAIVRANDLSGFTIGIRFEPRTRITGAHQWVIADNLVLGARQTTQLPTGLLNVRIENNSP